MSEAKNMNAINVDKDKSRVKQKKQKKFLLIANALIIGLLIIWLSVGNLLAGYFEQPMLKAKSSFEQRYPEVEANASAIKLKELYSKLELDEEEELRESDNDSIVSPDGEPSKYVFGSKVNIVFKSLLDYSFEQLNANNQSLEPLPEDLKLYFISKSKIINEIITLLKNSPLIFNTSYYYSNSPNVEANYQKYALFQAAQISDEHLVNLQKVLLVEAIQEYQFSQTQKVFDILTAVWNLNLALQKQAMYGDQSIALDLFSDQLSFLRKTNLSIEVLKLIKPDYPKYFLPSLEFGILDRATSFSGGLLPLSYSKLEKIDYWEKNMQMISKIEKQDICLFDPKALQEETRASYAWWNVWGRYQNVILVRWRKPYKKLIEWEFTQKILQAKITAAQTGFSSNFQSTEYSSICKTIRYNYKITDNGQKINIQMQNLPQWWDYKDFEDIKEDNLPKTFSDYQVTDNGQRILIQTIDSSKWNDYKKYKNHNILPTTFSFTVNQLPR
jgi:hypothetical protein